MKQNEEFIIFMAYADADKTFVSKMKEILKSIQMRFPYQDVLWYDMNVSPGKEFERENEEHLKLADIILLLISLSFISSEYSNNVQIKQAIQRHEQGDARVIPVLLRSTDITGTLFAKLTPLPANRKPISNWKSRDDAYAEISIRIRQTIDELRRDMNININFDEATVVQPRNITEFRNRKER